MARGKPTVRSVPLWAARVPPGSPTALFYCQRLSPQRYRAAVASPFRGNTRTSPVVPRPYRTLRLVLEIEHN
jgi:hypothetical protein